MIQLEEFLATTQENLFNRLKIIYKLFFVWGFFINYYLIILNWQTSKLVKKHSNYPSCTLAG